MEKIELVKANYIAFGERSVKLLQTAFFLDSRSLNQSSSKAYSQLRYGKMDNVNLLKGKIQNK